MRIPGLAWGVLNLHMNLTVLTLRLLEKFLYLLNIVLLSAKW